MNAVRKRHPIRPYVFRKILRDAAWTEQGSKCRYCRSRLERHQVTADHVEARIKGGTDDAKNITAACWPCNQAKGSMSAAMFMKILKGREWMGFDIEMIRIIRRLNLATERACKRIRRFAT